ncbi:MAG: hypothetical protein KGI41_01710 [Patescibacteria group bacterium]|nr:hypothetical protein [Patescibacteria group bacterium]
MFKLIIFIVLAVLALSFFGISIRAIATSPVGQDNFLYITQVFVDIWNACIAFMTHLVANATGGQAGSW